MPTSERERFHEAVRAGDEARVAELLGREPSLASTPSAEGLSPVMLAAYHRRTGVLRELLALRSPSDIFEAASVGDAGRLGELVGESPDVLHARHVDGFTALHLAAYFAHPRAVRLLVDAGADVNAVADNPSRVRPLHSAAAGRDAESVAMLVDAGAELDARQRGGWTALMAAAQHGDVAIVERLLGAGASVAATADDGRGAADLARDAGHADCVALLEGAHP